MKHRTNGAIAGLMAILFAGSAACGDASPNISQGTGSVPTASIVVVSSSGYVTPSTVTLATTSIPEIEVPRKAPIPHIHESELATWASSFHELSSKLDACAIVERAFVSAVQRGLIESVSIVVSRVSDSHGVLAFVPGWSGADVAVVLGPDPRLLTLDEWRIIEKSSSSGESELLVSVSSAGSGVSCNASFVGPGG